jgi:flagellar protein FlbD
MVTLILLSRLGGPEFALNPDLIERAEATPDTVVTLVGGNKYVVRESLEEVIELIRLNRAQVIATAEVLGADVDFAAHAAMHQRPHRAHAHLPAQLSAVVPLHPRDR